MNCWSVYKKEAFVRDEFYQYTDLKDIWPCAQRPVESTKQHQN